MRTPSGLNWSQRVAIDEVPLVGDGPPVALLCASASHRETGGGIHKDSTKCRETKSFAGALNINDRSWDDANVQFHFDLRHSDIFGNNQRELVDLSISDQA